MKSTVRFPAPAKLRRICAVAGMAVVAGSPASAQTAPFFDTPEDGGPGFNLPALNEYAPAERDGRETSRLKTVHMEARISAKGGVVENGLIWRVFSPIAGDDGKLPIVASSKGGSTTFRFEPGDYYVNVSFGKASVTKRMTVPRVGAMPDQTVVLDAGGLRLHAVTGKDVAVPAGKLRFSIYTDEEHAEGERSLVVSRVQAGTVVRLKAGTYHVVSDYGKVNAVIGADIRVEAGKLTDATIQHRAAQLTLKLVSSPNGEAIADTAWSILTSAGDVVSESVGAFPSLVLAEGEYTAVARNKGKIYQSDFSVEAGRNEDVEVTLQQQARQRR